MFNWLVGRFIRQEYNPEEVGDAAEAELDVAEKNLEELVRCIKTAESELEEIEERETELREEAERLLMQSHDESEGIVTARGQAILEAEVRRTLKNITELKEDHELKILKLELRKAGLLGEQLKAQELLRELGRLDPLSDVSIPPYPGIINETAVE
eukprot:TRINITY_DN7112_c0_g1_i1.p1 TRINITY_DN7112_c0_g1~~TRINITY_DN7112_c0_g1_i1.p1  ORF type:complete len:156 (+),score=27.26 TRINITY_DN7112_c0_g1_i1:540-1007(+)